MQKHVDLRTLEIAVTVVECGSMSETAKRYGLTQSAVSQAVRRIEAMIDTPLLYRDRRPLSATNAGRILAERVRELTRDAGAALDAARAAAALPERLDLRLGMVDSFAGTIGAYLVKELVDGGAASALRLSAWSGLAFSHTEALMRHAIDAAITSDPMEDLADIARHPLCREPYLLVAPRHLAPDLAERTLGEVLSHHRLVRHSARSHMGMQVERHLRRLGLDPLRSLEFDTSDALVAMVATGIGVAVTTPFCLLQASPYREDVVAMPLPGPSFSRELLLATRRGEFETVAPRIADIAQNLVRARALPRMVEQAPWLRDRLPWMMGDARA